MEPFITVLILAKSSSLRTGLQALLSSIPRIQTLALVEEISAALKMTAEIFPTLAVLESNSLPGQVGNVIQQIKHISPQSKCLVLIENPEEERTIDLTQAEAVVLKGTSPDDLVALIERVLIQPTS